MRAFNFVHTGTVGVFAPSSPFPEDRYQAGLDVLRQLGFTIIEAPNLREKNGYLAGSDDLRLSLFHEVLADPAIDLLWAARGGYGLHRILDRVDFDLLKRSTKPIVGFSDLTLLHLLSQKHGLTSVHGPVITQLGSLPANDLETLKQVLSGEWSRLVYQSPDPPLSGGVVEGTLVGGCLSIVQSIIGTSFFDPPKDSILFLEDVGEATYRIDRMLTHLRLAGVFDRVRGIALGEFVGCSPRNEDEPDVATVLKERLSSLEIPILTNLPIGHGQRNAAFPHGARARLDAVRGELRILGP